MIAAAPLSSIVALARAGALDHAWSLFRAAGHDERDDDPAVLTVMGRLLKDSAATELRQALRAVHRGERYFAASPDAPEAADALGVLTPRERDVLRGIARGRTNKEIAGELGIGARTVETHRESLMRKLGVRTVAGLTRLALESGLTGV